MKKEDKEEGGGEGEGEGTRRERPCISILPYTARALNGITHYLTKYPNPTTPPAASLVKPISTTPPNCGLRLLQTPPHCRTHLHPRRAPLELLAQRGEVVAAEERDDDDGGDDRPERPGVGDDPRREQTERGVLLRERETKTESVSCIQRE